VTDTAYQGLRLPALGVIVADMRDGLALLAARAERRHFWMMAGIGAVVAAGAVTGLAVHAARSNELIRDRQQTIARVAATGFSDAELRAMMSDAGPGALRLAARAEQDGFIDQRPAGWALWDLKVPPAIEIRPADADAAAKLNASIPVDTTYNPVAKQFFIKDAAEKARALQCLTAAIYYEAATEPRAGKEAVAQVVLNRVRHPAYPKSVCGVVFQGSERYTGCQFSFTCDGSMARGPARWAWKEAGDVAARALNGYVMAGVGSATNYHANYVMPYWSPSLIKVAQYGLHIFYRPAGPALLNGHYQGGEARFTKVSLIGKPQPGRPGRSIFGLGGIPGLKTPPPTEFVQASLTAQGRVHAIIAAAGGAYATKAPMHEMIAMRAAMAREARTNAAAMRLAQAQNLAANPGPPATPRPAAASPQPAPGLTPQAGPPADSAAKPYTDRVAALAAGT
jgi:hypothetical protein